jgi:hypothetical protein
MWGRMWIEACQPFLPSLSGRKGNQQAKNRREKLVWKSHTCNMGWRSSVDLCSSALFFVVRFRIAFPFFTRSPGAPRKGEQTQHLFKCDYFLCSVWLFPLSCISYWTTILIHFAESDCLSDICACRRLQGRFSRQSLQTEKTRWSKVPEENLCVAQSLRKTFSLCCVYKVEHKLQIQWFKEVRTGFLSEYCLHLQPHQLGRLQKSSTDSKQPMIKNTINVLKTTFFRTTNEW